jgi:hypothetical protein
MGSDGAGQGRRSLDRQAEDLVKAVSGSLLLCMTVSEVCQPQALPSQVQTFVLRLDHAASRAVVCECNAHRPRHKAGA